MLRVLSVHDAREWLLPLPPGAQGIRVADVKRLVRQQQTAAAVATSSPFHVEAAVASESDTFVVFRGRFLADVDVIDLNALTATDFLVLAHESVDDSDAVEEKEEEEEQESKEENEVENEMAQQLADMGFDPARARVAVRRSGGDLSAAIALLTGDARVPLAVHARANAVRRNPQLHALQPALDELEVLRVRQAAAVDGFRAIMRLKEFAPTAALEQLNTHPAAAVAYWRLPLERADREPAEELREETPASAPSVTTAAAAADDDVVDRLASMGFDRDLVAAVYESCGRHEEAALNALCEMLQ